MRAENLASVQVRMLLQTMKFRHQLKKVQIRNFFVLNMFVGVVVENFHKCREEQEREEKARRAAKRAKKFEEKRKSKERN